MNNNPMLIDKAIRIYGKTIFSTGFKVSAVRSVLKDNVDAVEFTLTPNFGGRKASKTITLTEGCLMSLL